MLAEDAALHAFDRLIGLSVGSSVRWMRQNRLPAEPQQVRAAGACCRPCRAMAMRR